MTENVTAQREDRKYKERDTEEHVYCTPNYMTSVTFQQTFNQSPSPVGEVTEMTQYETRGECKQLVRKKKRAEEEEQKKSSRSNKTLA